MWTLNSVWQSVLPWMRLDTESMPLLAYDQLRVENPIEDEVIVECYDDVMTGEFSQFEENSVNYRILSLPLLMVWPGCRSTW